MTARRPGQWPVTEPADLEAFEEVSTTADAPDQGELYVQRQQERALHEMILDSIRHGLEQQPTVPSVLTAARNWCGRITAAAEDIAQAKRKAA